MTRRARPRSDEFPSAWPLLVSRVGRLAPLDIWIPSQSALGDLATTSGRVNVAGFTGCTLWVNRTTALSARDSMTI